MNVAQLIEDLQKMPQHLPVKVLISEAYLGDADGETAVGFCEEDAI